MVRWPATSNACAGCASGSDCPAYGSGSAYLPTCVYNASTGVTWELDEYGDLSGYPVALAKADTIAPIALPGQFLVLDPADDPPGDRGPQEPLRALVRGPGPPLPERRDRELTPRSHGVPRRA